VPSSKLKTRDQTGPGAGSCAPRRRRKTGADARPGDAIGPDTPPARISGELGTRGAARSASDRVFRRPARPDRRRTLACMRRVRCLLYRVNQAAEGRGVASDSVATGGTTRGRKKEHVRWPVSRVLCIRQILSNPNGAMAIPLGRRLPDASRDRPGRRSGRQITCRPYLVLLPVGLAKPVLLPGPRCALTAPFQPCRTFRVLGGVISVALSLRSPSPAVSRHRVSVEPGLSSSPCGPAAIRPSDAEAIMPAPPPPRQGRAARWCRTAERRSPQPGSASATRCSRAPRLARRDQSGLR
jgi:hypothetical protein